MKNLNHKDVLIRTAKTFVASFLSVFVVALSNLLDVLHRSGLSAFKAATAALATSALAAGVTAVWNYVLQLRQM